MKIFALLFMGLTASIASFFLKKATANGLQPMRLLKSPFLYLGGGLYVVSALLNLYLLRILPYSLVVPLGSLTYIWTLFLSYKLLGEKISKQKLLGIACILIGVSLLFAA